jgi:hypothetical protein
VWFGGLICLAVVFVSDVLVDPSLAWRTLFHSLALGLLAQAVAMFASLIAIRRRQTRTRFNVFLYQAAGAIAGLSGAEAWRSLNNDAIRPMQWWGLEIDAQDFYLVSLALFLFWALIGCYRLMRLELQIENRPTVWLAFILFMAVYLAGLGRVPFVELQVLQATMPLRLAVASATLAALTYMAVLFEPKDRVLYRWLGEMVRKGRTDLAVSRLQCWMIAYAVTAISAIALAYQVGGAETVSGTILNAPMVLAGLGFLTRDLGIFLYFGLAPEQKRGDMPAVVTLAVLYVLLPILFRDGASPLALIYPTPTGGLAGMAFAWIEALAVWFLVVSIRGKQTAALSQT